LKHRLIAFFIVLTMLLSYTVCADAPAAKYTFEQAAKIVLDKSPDYKGIGRKIDDAYDYYEYLGKRIPDEIKIIKNMNQFIAQRLNQHMELLTAYSNYRMAKQAKDNVKANLLLGLREAVIGVEKANMAVKEVDINRRMLNDQLKLLEIQNEYGLISKNDYRNNKRELNDNLKALDNADKAVDTAYHMLNMLMSRKDTKDIVIDLDATEIPLERLDLEKIKKDLINKSDKTADPGLPIKSLYEERNLIKTRYSLICECFDSLSKKDQEDEDIIDILVKSRKDFEVADEKYNNAMKNFDKSFDDMITDIKDLYEDIHDLKEELADEKDNQKIYKTKHDAGLISKIEYESLRDEVILLENELKKLELELNLSYAKLLAYSDLKKVVVVEQ
jgi:TolA-binding protein/polyhydroxyalkanoate synthesis regulator phasin